VLEVAQVTEPWSTLHVPEPEEQGALKTSALEICGGGGTTPPVTVTEIELIA
jgi:hypothetical protein